MSNLSGSAESASRDGHISKAAGVVGVILDSVRTEDLPTLSRWMNNVDELHLWTTRRTPMLYEDLEADIRERCRAGLFTVLRNGETQELVGFLDGTVRDLHGIAEFQVYVPRKWRMGSGLHGVWGVYRFVSHLFNNYSLRKAYCQTYAYNTRVIHLIESTGFVKEGCFKNFTWWRDKYWDMLVYSLDRRTLEAVQRREGRFGRLLRRLESS